MADLKLDLDPKKILTALDDLSAKSKELATEIEAALGKQAPQSIDKMEKAAEKGSSAISTHFRNLGTRIKQDLKSAFDIGGLMGGLKIAKELAEGVKQVFDLEKAFDRLNTRLGLSGKAYQEFRNAIGSSVAKTGQKLEDVMPGVETAASKGGVKSPAQLSMIGEALGKVRAATGESTEALSDAVVEILKTQGKAVTGDSFKKTLDALQGTRTTGAFKTAAEAGQAVEQISPYAKQFGIGTREIGGLASTASRAGGAGQDILRQLFEKASAPGGGTALNSILGQNVFKVGKEGQTTGLNADALGKIDMKKFGAMSNQILEAATGLQGASGADLQRFVEAFKGGMGDYKKVVNGANETNSQFKTATNNLASGFDQFKEKTKNAGREIGDGLSTAAKAFLSKDFHGALDALKQTGKAASENKGVIGGALALTAGAALMAGKGAKGLLGAIPGLGGTAAGVAEGKALQSAAGVTPVFVVNADQMGGGGAAGGVMGKVAGLAGKGGLLGGAAVGGFAAGSYLANTEVGQKVTAPLNPVIDKVFKMFDVGGVGQAQKDLDASKAKSKARFGGGDSADIKKAVADGMVEGHNRINKNKQTQFSNPSRPPGIGSSQ